MAEQNVVRLRVAAARQIEVNGLDFGVRVEGIGAEFAAARPKSLEPEQFPG
ncbi:hypothetical protein [Mycolicibacterium sp.]|uniref:hypothetical protein n=1 Tax=Mycolicibacterium sp. TaxID=2320850 RepID=UPI001A33F4DD|nr:hypothetical protein [Mycolicibacterium sp.]MBJ7337557.1 hypothetical protein [Mycolicibacterium sp.]